MHRPQSGAQLQGQVERAGGYGFQHRLRTAQGNEVSVHAVRCLLPCGYESRLSHQWSGCAVLLLEGMCSSF